LRQCTSSGLLTKHTINGIHVINSFDFVTISASNRKIKRWQFSKGAQTPIRVLIIPEEGNTITEAYVKPCHLVAFAAGTRFPTEMTSRIINEVDNKRYHMIFCHGRKPCVKVNTIATSLLSIDLLLRSKNYVKNIFSGYWTGSYGHKFTFPDYRSEVIGRSITGKSVIACERKTTSGWEFCDNHQQENWVTNLAKK